MGPVDVLVAVLNAGVIAVATAVAAEPSSESSTVAACSLGIVMGGLLLVRRERPVLVLVLSLIAVMGYNVTDFPGVSPIWPLLVPLYTVARCGQPLIGAAVGTSTLLVSIGWVLHAGAPPLQLLDGALREAAMLALALVAGTAVRTKEMLAHEFAARLAAERGQQERESARQLLAERLRIARELHDVTAHTIAVVGIQVNLARNWSPTTPTPRARCWTAPGRSTPTRSASWRRPFACCASPTRGPTPTGIRCPTRPRSRTCSAGSPTPACEWRSTASARCGPCHPPPG